MRPTRAQPRAVVRALVRALVGTPTCALLLLAVAAAPDRCHAQSVSTTLSAEKFSAGVAIDWFALSLQIAQQTPGFSPPVAARAFGYLGLTLYEAVLPGMPGHVSLAGQLNELSSLPWAQPDEPLHWPTAANAALATMARMMFPTASAENKARIEQLERNIALKHTADFDPAVITPEIGNRSESFGRLMAMAVMTWARTDGGHEAWSPPRRSREPYVPPSGQGQWTATPPAFAAPLLPYWGNNRPMVLGAASDCPAPPPLPYSEAQGSAFFAEGQEVYRIANQATQSQRQFALYWADDPGKTPTPAGHWMHIAGEVLKARKASLADAAATYARLGPAMSDAFVVAWHAKYQLNQLRPVSYVQLTIDSNWLPALMDTPPFPEYPSAHSVQSSAAAKVLGAIFGERLAFTDNTHNDRGWGPRRFESFDAAADEAALSRIYAGIHFRSAVTAGQAQGLCVARRVMALTTRR